MLGELVLQKAIGGGFRWPIKTLTLTLTLNLTQSILCFIRRPRKYDTHGRDAVRA